MKAPDNADKLAALGDAQLALLPTSMRYLAAIIGLPALLKLVQHHGGGAPIAIPKHPQPDHPLAALLGAAAFSQLAQHYQGESLAIAKCDQAVTLLQHRQIRHEYYGEGKSLSSIALAHGYTTRWIRQICHQRDDLPFNDKQTPLF